MYVSWGGAGAYADREKDRDRDVERGEIEKRNRIVSGCRSVISGFVENETKNEFHAGKSSSSGIMSRAE